MIIKTIPYFKPSIGKDEINEVLATLKSGWLTSGPRVEQFENSFAEYIGSRYAIAVSSCTAALHMSLAGIGVSKGDEVITSPLTFVSTANVIIHQGARPVFADITKDTYNIDPDEIRKKITSKTKAIIPVHYAGHPCNLDEIRDIAKEHGLEIIEDAAHAAGSEYKRNKIGKSGNPTCFSFYVSKNMTTGEGGIITTNNHKFAKHLKILRNNGITKDAWKRHSKGGNWDYEVMAAGFKSNMTDLQAALGIHQLKKIDEFNKKRRELAKNYTKELSGLDVTLPVEKDYAKHVYYIFPILLNSHDRNAFINKMKKNNIGTSVHFIPLHLQPFYQRTLGYKKGDFPIAENAFKGLVSLPIYPDMKAKDQRYVCSCIKKTLK